MLFIIFNKNQSLDTFNYRSFAKSSTYGLFNSDTHEKFNTIMTFITAIIIFDI